MEFVLVKKLVLGVGLNFGYGLTDIKDSDWRIKDSDGKYNPSHNIAAGLNLGVSYIF